MGAKKDLKTLFFRFVLAACYCLIGASIFYAIEHNDHYDDEVNRKEYLLNKTREKLMDKLGINKTEFESLVMKIIDAKSDTPLQWTFARGIDLCWQTMTTVGYGNKPPTTLAGQLFLIPFAIFGIPLTLLMLNTVGQNICHFVAFVNKTIEKKVFGKKECKPHCKVKLLCSVSFLAVVLLVFMAGVSVKIEGWSFGVGLYAWFVTFSTVGFGDYIPGNSTDSIVGPNRPLAIIYRLIFVVIGLGLISTIFNAMTDCIEEKRNEAESKSWVEFIISAFGFRNEENTQETAVSEMTVYPSTNNPSLNQ